MKNNEKVHGKEKEFNDCIEFQEPDRRLRIWETLEEIENALKGGK